jgi:hypothetical protein
MDNLLEGAETYGKFKIYSSMIFTGILAVFFLILTVYFGTRKPGPRGSCKNQGEVEVTVKQKNGSKKVVCQAHQNTIIIVFFSVLTLIMISLTVHSYMIKDNPFAQKQQAASSLFNTTRNLRRDRGGGLLNLNYNF